MQFPQAAIRVKAVQTGVLVISVQKVTLSKFLILLPNLSALSAITLSQFGILLLVSAHFPSGWKRLSASELSARMPIF